MRYNDILTDVKLVFIRNRFNSKSYIVLVSTDLSLTEDEIIKLYSRRWNIETMFKVCKSILKLEKGTQSTSYDGITAHVTLTFMRYFIIS